LIFIGLGANLPTPTYGPPRAALGAALDALSARGIGIPRRSSWYRTAPVPRDESQPWYVNGVAEAETALGPLELLQTLLDVEEHFGRVRGERNAPRTLDLDLIAYHDQIIETGAPLGARIPHPRLASRAFVVLPLHELAPDWRHPGTGEAVAEMAQNLPPDQEIERMPDADGAWGTEWREGATT
jgi:2-amino-4-hydroxy-6-hydroxymethyldihydropteridine diphosphokinase